MSEKIFKPTERKRREAREKGIVAKSEDLIYTFILLFSVVFIYLYMDNLISFIYKNLNFNFNILNSNIDLLDSNYILFVSKKNMLSFFMVLVFYLLPVLLIAVILNLVQVKFVISKEGLKFNFDKLNPVNNIKNIYNSRKIFDFVKSLIKLFIVILIIYKNVKETILDTTYMYDYSLNSMFNIYLKIFFKILINIAIIFLVISIIDYAYKKYKHEKDLMMTKEEMMEEFKREEGNPEIKKKQKEMYVKLTQKQIKKVKEATFVVTNPTHFAVAIKYNKKIGIPIVLVKGIDAIAQEIKRIAKENEIPIIENKPLARGLYFNVKEGDPIPKMFFNAVIDIILYLYKLNPQKYKKEFMF